MKPTLRAVTAVTFTLLAAVSSHAQATLYGVGDLSGGSIWSQVRDVTKTGGVIYAVGSSSANNGPLGDTAFLWASTGSITAISYVDPSNPNANGVFITGSDITSDASYIATRSLINPTGNGRAAVRVTTSGLTSSNLGFPGGFSPPGYAVSIADDGHVLYGVTANGSANSQATRFAGDGSGATAIPFANGGDTTSYAVARAVSGNGNLLLGTSGTSASGGPGSRAFFYNDTNSSIGVPPLLSGGTWSQGLALNSAGTLALLGGDTATNANGEVYLFDGSTITALGTPNPSLGLNIFGGMNADGSVVGMSWTGGSNTSYLYNTHGWQDFNAIAAMSGADLSGWSALGINGISEDGTLVWGDGLHNGNTEGYIMEFSSGYLSAIPEPSTYAALAGAAALGLAVWHRRRRTA